jgi:hypothetical protein
VCGAAHGARCCRRACVCVGAAMHGPLRLLALPATERQRLRRALRVESPRAWALSVLALVRDVRAHAAARRRA